MTSTTRLPKKLVEEVLSIKGGLDPQIYRMVCFLVVSLDDADLLNDQICISRDNSDEACLEWPHYGVFFDIQKDRESMLFKLRQPKTKISADLQRIDDAATLLSSVLEMVIDKKDVYDEYRKEKRTLSNTMECIRGDPF